MGDGDIVDDQLAEQPAGLDLNEIEAGTPQAGRAKAGLVRSLTARCSM
ncbi:hypothetical protein [Amycolatopsis sp. WAC 04169]|nr:hypothetical protein [Amycolatopsis sp. WAC 04169]